MSARINGHYKVAFILILLAAVIVFFKLQIFGYSILSSHERESWVVDLSIKIKPNKKHSLEGEMYLPRLNENYSIAEERLITSDIGTLNKSYNNGNRSVFFSKINPNKVESIYYRATLYKIYNDNKDFLWNNIVPINDKLQTEIDNITKKVTQYATNEQKFVLYVLAELYKNPLNGHSQSNIEILSLILSQKNIKNQIMNGIALHENKSTKLIQWIEVIVDGQRMVVDLKNQSLKPQRGNLFPVFVGTDGGIITGNNISNYEIDIAVKPHIEKQITEMIWNNSKIAKIVYAFSIFTLPASIQIMLQLLVLIPVGTLINAFLRQIIGIEIFGTFMPVLIALFFIQTGATLGTIVLGFVIVTGLCIRYSLESMQLLFISRISIILTAIIFIIILATISLANIGVHLVSSVMLFPIIVFTMIIERITVVSEEIGYGKSLKITLSTWVVSFIIYSIIKLESLQYIFMMFPETLLIIIALLLIIGRYNGYRLSEYIRFKILKNVS